MTYQVKVLFGDDSGPEYYTMSAESEGEATARAQVLEFIRQENNGTFRRVAGAVILPNPYAVQS